MLKRWLSKQKNAIQVMKQCVEELAVTVHHMKANSAISLQLELVMNGRERQEAYDLALRKLHALELEVSIGRGLLQGSLQQLVF
ncbi:hypothetical protein Q9233_016355 [Columba guinea]|nr:hypothetical protein Q9233_016355 [Columba guinea]